MPPVVDAVVSALCPAYSPLDDQAGVPWNEPRRRAKAPSPAPAGTFFAASLKTGTPGDAYEQEADHVANKVMRMPGPQLQRACAGGCRGTCPSCTSQPEERLQTQPAGRVVAG